MRITPTVRIVEDDDHPHYVLSIHKSPDDAEAVTNFVRPRDPNSTGPMWTCRSGRTRR